MCGNCFVDLGDVGSFGLLIWFKCLPFSILKLRAFGSIGVVDGLVETLRLLGCGFVA